jgi:hypothetical protein
MSKPGPFEALAGFDTLSVAANSSLVSPLAGDRCIGRVGCFEVTAAGWSRPSQRQISWKPKTAAVTLPIQSNKIRTVVVRRILMVPFNKHKKTLAKKSTFGDISTAELIGYD